MRKPSLQLCSALVASLPGMLCGQQAPVKNVPIRELSAPSATSTDHFGLITAVRGLSNGALLVNDSQRHQLILLDAHLQREKIVLDTAGAAQSYARGAYTPIAPYLSDSTIYVDAEAMSFVMITPSGAVGRVMAPPTTLGWNTLARYGVATDPRGDVIYRLDASRPSTQSEDTAQVRRAFTYADSLLVVRGRFETRTLDTIGRVRNPAIQELKVRFETSRTVVTSYPNLLAIPDDYAVLSDGSVLFVRGHDYHVDIVQPNGTRIIGPKLPFDWKQLTDADKQALIDSANAKLARATASDAAASRTGASPARGVSGQDRVPTVGNQKIFENGVVSKDQIPDYYPPIRAGALKADLSGHLWILPTTSAQSKSGELIYDVVNNRGELTERVRVPMGRAIAGFGAGGEVYLMARDSNGWKLETTVVRK